ncbi:MAG: ATP-binding protein, partial [Phototrophicaceae bacterium]
FLFKPFSKSKISTQPTNGEASTGLGLWIVSEMMKIQNGQVGMYNDVEGGACFWVELPLAPDNN